MPGETGARRRSRSETAVELVDAAQHESSGQLEKFHNLPNERVPVFHFRFRSRRRRGHCPRHRRRAPLDVDAGRYYDTIVFTISTTL